jgi:arylsulfatase A-like enzyme
MASGTIGRAAARAAAILVGAGAGTGACAGGDAGVRARAYPAVGAVPSPRPPSILFVLTDDMATGDTASMAAVQDLLVNRGTSFSRFHLSVPLCCPSRSTILRGQYAHDHGVFTNDPPFGGYRRFLGLGHEHSTVATWLHDAGYRTGLFGKYLNDYGQEGDRTHVPPGWDEWCSPAGGDPYSGFDYVMNENGSLVPYGGRPRDYATDVFSGKAEEFLRRASADGVPFFAYVATYAPHSPATPAPRDEGTFRGAEAPRPPSFDEAVVDDKPRYVRRRPPLSPEEIDGIDDLYRRRQESLRAVDRMVARLLDALASAGRLDDTWVFFLSDNGFHLGQHRLPPGKSTPYDEDVRVPLIVRGPGVPADAVLPHIVGNTDLAPTLAAIAGVAPPSFVDGRSLLPLLGPAAPPEESWRRVFLLEHIPEPRKDLTAAAPGGAVPAESGSSGPPDVPVAPPFAHLPRTERPVPAFAGLRTGRHTYVEYDTGERELYDMQSDPFQMENLAGTADAGLLAALSERLALLRVASGEACRALEDAPIPGSP